MPENHIIKYQNRKKKAVITNKNPYPKTTMVVAKSKIQLSKT